MKIQPSRLEESLKKPHPRLIWLSGDEPLQLQEAADLVRRHARQQGIEEREVHDVSAQFQWKKLLESTASLSLFGGNKLLEIRLGSSKPGKEGGEVIQQLCRQSAQSGDLLLFTSDKLDASQSRSAWYKTVEDQGMVVQIWPVETSRLPGWITERSRAMGLTLDPEATSLLAEKVEGNLLAASQEIEKLKLFVQPGEVLDAQRLLSLIEDASRFSLFDLADACLAGQADRALRILRGLQAEGTEAPLLLWAVTREIRQTATLLHRLNEGLPFDSLCQQLRIWDKRRPLYRQASQRISLQQVHQLLQLAQRCDQAIKGSGEPAAELLLDLVYRFST
ncbi:DNA polymerase III subunit delta [Marinospirillum alkaliphilum]|uniref:DNA polymerase III subunit delta n=1 Tax=Marinospirillum alkaliphilum DSM 21637 TaxID=1122209 RepID=A0A1K1YNS4_9GAMM|nr:DNA polymerase III subunit delta [Marinospirillum alkaliphilum]SFX63091.1 DNA polymerase III, delta subunit [Marinospirillum alkaliphilum DSM 21637]